MLNDYVNITNGRIINLGFEVDLMVRKPEEVVDLVKTPRIIDGRNVLDRDRWVKAGWKFHALGRSES